MSVITFSGKKKQLPNQQTNYFAIPTDWTLKKLIIYNFDVRQDEQNI